MDLQLGAVREAIAAGALDGLNAYARPPGSVTVFPVLLVGDPQQISYQSSYGGRPLVTLPLRVIVARAAAELDAAELDRLVSTLPDQLAAIESDLWSELNVTELAGGYFDWQQGGNVIGLAADLTTEIVIKRNEV